MASVIRTPAGTWQVRWWDPTRRQRSKTFKRKADANGFRVEIEHQINGRRYNDPDLGRTTVAAMLERVEASRLNRRSSTRVRDESLIRNHIVPVFGEVPLDRMQPHDVRKWVADLDRRGLAPATVKKTYELLARVFDTAVDDGYLTRTPCRGITLPKERSKEHRYLTHSEVQDLAAAIDPRYRVLILTAAYTGMRFGEIAALRVGRFEPLRRSITVDQTTTRNRGKIEFNEPKTEKSKRRISLPGALADEIAGHIDAFPDHSQLVFTAPQGGVLRYTHFIRRFFKPAVTASIGEPCVFHDLRHTHAALLIAQNEHPKVIQERLGHASISTTLDTYGHLFDGLDEAAADTLDQAIRTAQHPTRASVVPLRS